MKPTVASNRRTRPPIVPWNSRSTRISSSGSTASTKFVQPRRSAKIIATCRRWLRRIDSSPDETIASASWGERNRRRRCSRSSSLELRPHALLERPVEIEQLGGLCLDRVVVALDPQQRPDAGEQLVPVERLRDEVVRPGLDRLRLLRSLARREHDHRQHRGLLAARGAAGRRRSRPAAASARRAARDPASPRRRARARHGRRWPRRPRSRAASSTASSRRTFSGTSSTTRIRAGTRRSSRVPPSQ